MHIPWPAHRLGQTPSEQSSPRQPRSQLHTPMCEHAPCPEQADGQDGQPEVAEEGVVSVARRRGRRRWEEAMLIKVPGLAMRE